MRTSSPLLRGGAAWRRGCDVPRRPLGYTPQREESRASEAIACFAGQGKSAGPNPLLFDKRTLKNGSFCDDHKIHISFPQNISFLNRFCYFSRACPRVALNQVPRQCIRPQPILLVPVFLKMVSFLCKNCKILKKQDFFFISVTVNLSFVYLFWAVGLRAGPR